MLLARLEAGARRRAEMRSDAVPGGAEVARDQLITCRAGPFSQFAMPSCPICRRIRQTCDGTAGCAGCRGRSLSLI